MVVISQDIGEPHGRADAEVQHGILCVFLRLATKRGTRSVIGLLSGRGRGFKYSRLHPPEPICASQPPTVINLDHSDRLTHTGFDYPISGGKGGSHVMPLVSVLNPGIPTSRPPKQTLQQHCFCCSVLQSCCYKILAIALLI